MLERLLNGCLAKMKILVQNYSTGNLEMLEVPMITSTKGLLVETKASLVSVETEKAMIDVAKKSLLGKALDTPLPISAQGYFG